MPPKKRAKPRTKGAVERRIHAELKAGGWTATMAGPLGTLGAQALDIAQTQDLTLSDREKSTLNRELRITMREFREALAARAPAKGDAVDEAADEQSGGDAGAPDPGTAGGGDVVPFGRRGSSSS